VVNNQKTLRVLKTLRVWIFKIRGSSLAPAYRDGDYVVCLPVTRLRLGAVVVFDHPDYGRLIKRVEHVAEDGRLFVLGDDIDSVDSRRFGPIEPDSLLGRVVWHIRK
jgi:nickel-type superoxide dismutase maturation protease